MGFFKRLAVKATASTIEKSIPAASIEKLEKHYLDTEKLIYSIEDPDATVILIELKHKIIAELEKRGHELNVY